MREDFQLVVPMPKDTLTLSREVRFNMSYLHAHRLTQSAKWLGELLVSVKKSPQDFLPEEADLTGAIKTG